MKCFWKRCRRRCDASYNIYSTYCSKTLKSGWGRRQWFRVLRGIGLCREESELNHYTNFYLTFHHHNNNTAISPICMDVNQFTSSIK